MSALGYILGCIVDAVISMHFWTSQPDPIHILAHYLQACLAGPFEVEIRKKGRSHSNIAADLYQDVSPMNLLRFR